MADFCTVDELRSYLTDTGSVPMAGINDTWLDLAKTAATTAIQTACNRTFEPTTAAATRTFTFKRIWGSRVDYVGSIDWGVVYPTLFSNSEPPQVEVDDFFTDTQLFSAITCTDYTTGATYAPTRGWPYNAASKGDPFTRLEFALGTALPTTPGQLLVNARWGWASVPHTVKNACLLQASHYYMRRGYPVSPTPWVLDADVELMLNDFTRHWIAA